MPTALPLTFCEAVARRDRVEHLGIANDAGLAIVVAFAAVGLALTTDRPTRKYCRQRPKPFHSRQPPWSGLPLRAWPSGPRTIAQASAIFLIRLEEEGCSQAIYCVPARATEPRQTELFEVTDSRWLCGCVISVASAARCSGVSSYRQRLPLLAGGVRRIKTPLWQHNANDGLGKTLASALADHPSRICEWISSPDRPSGMVPVTGTNEQNPGAKELHRGQVGAKRRQGDLCAGHHISERRIRLIAFAKTTSLQR